MESEKKPTNREILTETAILILWFIAFYFFGGQIAVWLGYRAGS